MTATDVPVVDDVDNDFDHLKLLIGTRIALAILRKSSADAWVRPFTIIESLDGEMPVFIARSTWATPRWKSRSLIGVCCGRFDIVASVVMGIAFLSPAFPSSNDLFRAEVVHPIGTSVNERNHPAGLLGYHLTCWYGMSCVIVRKFEERTQSLAAGSVFRRSAGPCGQAGNSRSPVRDDDSALHRLVAAHPTRRPGQRPPGRDGAVLQQAA